MRIIRLDEVMRRTGLSRSTIYERAKRGSFPKQLKLGNVRVGDRASGWLESDIDNWIAEIVRASREEAASA